MSSATVPPPPPPLGTDCLACRITGTLAFAGLAVYAVTVARTSAKTSFGRGTAVVGGLGFLSIAAVRWTMDDVKSRQD